MCRNFSATSVCSYTHNAKTSFTQVVRSLSKAGTVSRRGDFCLRVLLGLGFRVCSRFLYAGLRILDFTFWVQRKDKFDTRFARTLS